MMICHSLKHFGDEEDEEMDYIIIYHTIDEIILTLSINPFFVNLKKMKH